MRSPSVHFLASKTLRRSLAVFGIVAALSAVGWLAAASNSDRTAQEPPSDRIEAEVITLTPRGFEPFEISRPHAPFLLMVDNRSGSPEMNLQLNRDTGARLHETRVPRESLDWNTMLDLEPGRYVLVDTSHPGWSCSITIRPR
jgi:hypothetical protein